MSKVTKMQQTQIDNVDNVTVKEFLTVFYKNQDQQG
jgi:hypothetical protein